MRLDDAPLFMDLLSSSSEPWFGFLIFTPFDVKLSMVLKC